MKKFDIKNLKINPIFYYILIALFALFICIPLFQTGVHTGHDGDFHISRTIGTIEQIEQGNSPFVISRFSNNLGFGWNLFYPPVNTALNVIFALLTGDVVIAMKIFIFFTFAVSGFSMFAMVKKMFKSNLAALIASILYMFAPYRMLNAYTRLAVGEMTSFIFIPIIFNGVYEILHGNTKKSYLYALGAIGLILSHNISTLLVCILGFIYVLINIKKLKDKKILKSFVLSSIIIVLCVLFFEVPLLQQQAGCDYEVFRYGKMYSTESVGWHALNPLQLFTRHVDIGADTSMYFCIGVPLLFGLILTPFVRKKKENYKDFCFFFVVGIISTIMATVVFPWKFMPSILLMIQFPWRMLEIVVFSFSVVAGVNYALAIRLIYEKIYNSFKNKSDKKERYFSIFIKTLSVALITTFSVVYALSFVSDLDYEYKDSEFYRQEEIIDTKMEVSRYSSFLEYWPQKAVRNIDYVASRDQNTAILSGNCNIENEIKENGILDFDISNVEEGTTLELPYLFYTGYVVTYTPSGSDFSMELDTYESENGLVQINLTGTENGHINVEYHATTLHKICIAISFTTFFIYIVYLIIRFVIYKYSPKLIEEENKKENNKKQK